MTSINPNLNTEQVVEGLRAFKSIKAILIFDNPWLMGDGPKAKQRLGAPYALEAVSWEGFIVLVRSSWSAHFVKSKLHRLRSAPD